MTERFPSTQITANSYLCLLLKDLSQKTLRNGWTSALPQFRAFKAWIADCAAWR